MARGGAKIPGTPAIPAGGVLLDRGGPLAIPKTIHMTQFQNCQIGIMQMVDNESGLVNDHTLMIKDPGESRTYQFSMTEEIRQELIAWLLECTPIGQKAPDAE